MSHPEKGFSVILILIPILLVIIAAGLLLKLQPRLEFPKPAITEKLPNSSAKSSEPDFGSFMKELGCFDQNSCMNACSKPENADKCKVMMQFMKDASGSNKVVDENNVPKVVEADFIDLGRIVRISKFRSGEGHDFSSNGETCRSMKHYFYSSRTFTSVEDQSTPKSPFINIYSPVNGVVLSINEEHTPIGKQIYIKSAKYPDYIFRLFHIFPLDSLKPGNTVSAGEKIGVIGADGTTDIAVQIGSFNGQYLSYFEVMPDEIFKGYKDRGINSLDDIVISRQYRDQHPFTCTSEQFNRQGNSPDDHLDLKPLP